MTTKELIGAGLQVNLQANWNQILTNDFPTDRGLRKKSKEAGTSYLSFRGFGPWLRTEFLKLSDNDVWLDVGAGDLYAQVDYLSGNYSSGKNTVAVAIAVEDSESEGFKNNKNYLRKNFPKRFRYLSGRRIEDIPVHELPKANIVSDLFGAMTFTDKVDQTLQRELDQLKVGGVMIARLQKAYIRDRENKRFGIQRYVESIKGAETLLYGWYTLVMRKIQDEILVPQLQLIDFISGTNAPNPKHLNPHFVFCERYYMLDE